VIWLDSHFCEIFPVLPPRIIQQVVSEPLVYDLGDLKVLGWKWCHSLIWVGSFLILVCLSKVLPLRFSQQVVSEPGLRLGRVQFDPVSKVFLMVISGKRVLYKCVNEGTSEGSWVMYSGLRMLPLEGKCINVVEEWLSLEREIVRYSSVSLSPTLGRNEKVKQHIRKEDPQTQRLKVLGWRWCHFLICGLTWFSFSWDLSGVSPSDSPNISKVGVMLKVTVSCFFILLSLLYGFEWALGIIGLKAQLTYDVVQALSYVSMLVAAMCSHC